jgi:site-specific recombinase XerD
MKTKAKWEVREAFKLSRFVNPSGQIVWRVSGMKRDGTRVRQNFKREDEAIAQKQALEVEALNIKHTPLLPTNLTREQLSDAERAVAELKSGFTLLTAARFFNNNFQDPLKPIKLNDAVEKFRSEKAAERLRPETLNNLRFRLGAFVELMPAQKLVSEIMAEQVNDFLYRTNGKPRGKRTIKNDRLALSNFFNWATARKHCAANPMDAVSKVRVGSKRPEVFNLATVRKLLDAALTHNNGKCLPYFVLGLFCGLRPTETERLTWDKIDLAEKLITIDAETAKVTAEEHCNERFVSISVNAVAWLLPNSIERLPLGIDRKDFEAIKTLAAIKVWPQDVLRHTAISNYQAVHNHEGLTAEWAGNSVKVVRKHYRRAIKPVDAASFWAIFPNSERTGNIIELPKPLVNSRPYALPEVRCQILDASRPARRHRQHGSGNSVAQSH